MYPLYTVLSKLEKYNLPAMAIALAERAFA